MPTLLEENVDAANIWMLTRDQVIVAGMSGTVIAINQLALWKNIEEFQIKNRLDCFEKVRGVFNHFLELDRIKNMNDKPVAE